METNWKLFSGVSVYFAATFLRVVHSLLLLIYSQISSITQHRAASSQVERHETSVSRISLEAAASQARLVNESYHRLKMELVKGFAECNTLMASVSTLYCHHYCQSQLHPYLSTLVEAINRY